MESINIEKKRIIVCSNIIWAITVFRKYLVKALVKNNYKVYIVSSLENFSDAGMDFLGDIDAEFIDIKLDRSSHNPFKDFGYFLSLYKIYKKINPDIVLHFTIKPNIYGSLACTLLRLPNINTINGLGSGLINKGIGQALIKKMYRFSLRKSYAVFFQNYDDLQYFAKNKLIKHDQSDYVPGSGINTDEYYLPIKKAGQKRTFLFVGRLIKDKGLYEYIEAIRNMGKDFREKSEFLLAGIIDNSNPTSVKLSEIELWEEEGLVKFLGKTDNIKDFFEKADFIVLPSYREGLSRLLLEAASCQKVLIASDVPGCREIVHNNINGFLCNVKDAVSLKNILEKAVTLDENTHSEFSRQSRLLVMESFTDKIVNEKYMLKINSALEKNSKK